MLRQMFCKTPLDDAHPIYYYGYLWVSSLRTLSHIELIRKFIDCFYKVFVHDMFASFSSGHTCPCCIRF